MMKHPSITFKKKALQPEISFKFDLNSFFKTLAGAKLTDKTKNTEIYEALQLIQYAEPTVCIRF
jgi:hypothetical protein